MAKTKPTDEKKDIFTEIDWRELTPIGFEFNTWTEMKNQDWTFPEIKEQFKEGGVLSDVKNQLYLYLGAQPIVGKDKKGKDFNQNMPYIVVIDCESELPSKIAKVSIQNGEAEVSDFRDHHLMWAPYVLPKNMNAVKNKQQDYRIFTLTLQERSGKQLSEEKVNNIQYLLPYALIPKIFETEKKREVNFVQFNMDCDLSEEGGKKAIQERKDQEEEYKKAQEENKAKKPKERVKLEKLKKPDYKIRKENGKEIISKSLEIYFDKLNDKLATFIPEFMEDNDLDEEMHEKIEQAIREQFKKEREVVDANYKSKVDEIASYSDKKKNDLNSIKIYKFYPVHPLIDTKQFVSNNINRFLGSATKTFPEPIKKDLSKLNVVDESVIKKLAAKETKEVAKEYEKNKAAAEKEMKEQEKKTATTTTDTAPAADTKGKKKAEKESTKEDTKEVAKDTAKDTAKDAAKDAAKDVKEASKEDTKMNDKEDTKEDAEEDKKVEKPTEKPAKKPSKKPAANTTTTTTSSTTTSTTAATTDKKRKEVEPEEKPTKADAKSNKKQKN